MSLFALCVAALLCEASWAQDAPSTDEPEEQSQEAKKTKPKGVRYSVNVEGDAPSSLLALLEQSLPLYLERSNPPASRAALRDRLQASLKVARQVLRAEGYYAGQVYGRIAPPLEAGAKARAVLQLEPGPQYTFGPSKLTLSGASDVDLQTQLKQTASEIYREGDPSQADIGLRLAPALAVRLKELGYPFAKVSGQTFRVDHAVQIVRPLITLETGQKARISSLDITGLETVESDYINRLAQTLVGGVYDQRQVNAFRERLIATGLFAGISIQPVVAQSQKPASAGEPDLQDVALSVDLAEGPMRQISAQAGFATQEGFSVEGAWSHRNFFGQGDIFTVRGRIAQLEQSIETELALPNFRRLDQTLSLGLGMGREDTDAFNALRATATAILERQVSERWAVSGGGRLEAQRVEDDLGRRTFYLGALPLLARYDGTSDIFDPQDGLRLNVQITPEAGVGDATLFFVTNDVLLRGYKSFDWGYGTVLAARLRLGSIAGEDAPTLPANRRFYAGGGGSIRGYGFQNVGPLDDDGDPFGGRSIIEFAVEARVKVTETIGIVPFMDAGNVYASSLPKLSNLQYGAGLGVRYHTDFAPIRLDIGTPINPRAGDDRIQVYISVGQSF